MRAVSFRQGNSGKSTVFSRDSLLKDIVILLVTVNWMGGRSKELLIFLGGDGLMIDDEG